MYMISNSLLLAHISFHLYYSTQKTLGKKKNSSIKAMEITFLPLAFSLILITITLNSTFRRRCRATGSSAAAALPPGTFGWPFSGETFHFLFGKPENFVGHRMKKYSPDIFRTKILGEKTAVICGPAGHKFVFSNENRLFAPFRPHPMQHLFRSYQNKAGLPPPDEASKSIRQPGFLKPEALARYLPDMDSVAQNLLRAHLFGKNEARIYPFAKTLTLTLACRFFLGIDDPTRITRLVGKFDDVTLGMHSVMVNLPGTAFYRANRAAAAIRKELIAVIEERKREIAASSGGQISMDILSHMIVVTDPTRKPMPDPEIADKIMGLLTAGYSTVATTITFLMKYVGLNPEVYRKIREEQMEIAGSKKAGELLEWDDMGKMKYSWNVVCETMRLVPPLQGTFREVITEFTYAGYTVPKGWKVYWTVSTTNMNPDYFKEPEKFNPSRYEEGEEAPPPYTYVPFGGGPRMCPGKEYARLAILAFVHNVVKSYRWEVLDPNEKVEGDMMAEPEKGLPVRLYHV